MTSGNTRPYFLGCPVWACENWQGHFYTEHAGRENFLPQYSSVFNTVEGNSTFHGLPTLSTIRRWAETTEEGFQFALKFPREISHQRRLRSVEQPTREFLRRLEILEEAGRAGPAFLQLPPDFSSRDLPALEEYLDTLPCHFSYAVEVRHADFFDQGEHEKAFNTFLQEYLIDRVLFDSRPLFSAPPSTSAEAAAQDRKPLVPHRETVTGQSPFIRLVGRDDAELVWPWWKQWAKTVAGWIEQGKKPYVFIHAPNEFFAPKLAKRFHRHLQEHLSSIPDLPSSPVEIYPVPPHESQLHLF